MLGATTMLGEITVKCPDCGFADILQADIPIGCDNKGRSENYLRFRKSNI